MFPSEDTSTQEFVKQLHICDGVIASLIEFVKEKHLDSFIGYCLQKNILSPKKCGKEAVLIDLEAAAGNVQLMVTVLAAQIEWESAADAAVMRLIGDLIFGTPPTEPQAPGA